MTQRFRRVVGGLVAVAALLTANVLANAGPATAETDVGIMIAAPSPQDKRVLLFNLESSWCLGIQGSSGSGGANAVMGFCNPTATNTWHIRASTVTNGALRWQFQNNLGMCLGVAGSSQANGARVVQGTCGGLGETSQFWRPNLNHIDALQNAHSGLCLEPVNHSDATGVQVVQTTCSGNEGTQKWAFV